MKIMSDLNLLFYQNQHHLIEFNLWINVIILWSLTFMICQEMTNYKEERIMMRNLIYIIFIISYVISLLDFVILSHVWFLEFDFNFDYIYISHSSSYLFNIDHCIHCMHLFTHLFSMHSFLFLLSLQLVIFTMYVFVI